MKEGLLYFYARRNGRAPGSLTARGGGLPYVSYDDKRSEAAMEDRKRQGYF
ncbi:MAG TPA: hypothetical protein VI542_20775 [Candidatus Tectomicrobia bacterium]